MSKKREFPSHTVRKTVFAIRQEGSLCGTTPCITLWRVTPSHPEQGL